jgi:hypothetical protein
MSFARQHLVLQQRSEALRMRSTELRLELAERAAVLDVPLALVDRGRQALHWVRRHPEWPTGLLVAAAVLRPKRAWRWGRRLLWGWRLWQRTRLELARWI